MLADKLRSASLSAKALPTFVSSSAVGVSGTFVTITAPTGIQNGDLLVALLFSLDGQDGIGTVAAGFNAQGQYPAADASVWLFSKIANSESGNYTFGTDGSGLLIGVMLCYRNATTINTIGSVTRASSATGTARSITPSYRGVLCAAYMTEANTSIVTEPSGMTQRARFNGGVSEAVVYDLSPQEASATDAKSITWGSASAVTSFQFQITNEPTVAPEFVASASTQKTATGATLTINKPTGTVEGDLMVAVMAARSATTDVWSGDTGWTEVADYGNGKPALRLAYKLAGASEPSAYTFTNSVSSHLLSGCILTYRYAAYDTIGSFTTGTDPLTLPSTSPSDSQSRLIAAGARDGASITLGTPTSMAARVTDNDATEPSYIVCDQIVAKGQTGTRSMSTGSTTGVAGIMLSIKPTRSLS